MPRSRSRSNSRGRRRNMSRSPRTTNSRDRQSRRSRSRNRSPNQQGGRNEMNRRSRSWSLDSLGRRRKSRNNRDRDFRESNGRDVRHRDMERKHYRSRSRSNSRDNGKKDQKQEDARYDDYRLRLLHGDDYSKDDDHQTPSLSNLSEEDQMKALLGFGGFDSSKGKQIDDNAKGSAVGGIRKDSKRVYRQYMNRKGGFNKPVIPK